MKIRKRTFPVIGVKFMGNKKCWAVVGPEREVLNLDYHPAFEKLYPRNAMFPCWRDVDNAFSKYRPDWEEIYSNIYEADCDYEFQVVSIVEDSRTFAKSLILRDQYGFEYKLKHPTKEDLRKVNGTIMCHVAMVSSVGLELETTSTGITVAQEIHQTNEELFDKLHDSRAATFRELNKRAMRGVWKSVIDKYPDTAHFIYELLQNADDAKATDVTILLGKEALVFKHNGSVHFSVSDDDDNNVPLGHINSITGIGDSTKGDENSTNKIGKFGIGFKSVFQYTDAPEIFDDYYRFRIRDYIVPERLDYDHESRDEGETLFHIPFKNPQAAFKEISAKLQVLANVTLFLHNLTHIRWRILSTNESRTYSKKITETFTSNRNILMEKLTLTDYNGERNLLMFSRNVDLKEEGRHKIYVGYYLNSDGTINTKKRPKVHCFFPTSETFDMCMIMHAPFLLVDNRQQIKPQEKTNEKLVEELGKLAAETLCELRDLGVREGKYLLNENIAEITQWDDYNPYGYSWRHVDETLIKSLAIINPCVEKIKNADLLLSAENKYYKASNIYSVAPESLAQLLNANQLKILVKAKKEIGILNSALNELWDYNKGEDVGIAQYTTQSFASDITPEFMSAQPLPWVNRLFAFLNNEVRKSWLPEEKNPYFLNAPIIQTRKGEWVPPYLDGHINVFMDGDPEEYNVVSNNIRASRQAEKFLKDIGCKAPDQLDYINTHILEGYSDSVDEYDVDQLLSDLTVILKYYHEAPRDSREKMMEKARRKLRIACISDNGEDYVLSPKDIYLDTQDLKRYFKNAEDAYFFDSAFYKDIIRDFGKDKVYDFLVDMGIRTLPIVFEPERMGRWDLTDHQREQLGLSTLRTTLEWIYDRQIAGLSAAVAKPDAALSHIIWKFISRIDLNEFRYGIFKYYYRTDYKKKYDSLAIETLRNNAWIFVDGKRRKPSQVSLEQFIRENYEVNNEICALLGINKSELDLAAAGASKEQISQYEMGKLANELDLTEDDLRKAAEDKKKRIAAQKAKEKKEQQKDVLTQDRQELHVADVDDCGGGVEMPTSKSSAEERAEKRQERLQEQKDKALNDIQRNEEFEDLRGRVKGMPKYSKEWFESLLLLEYKNEAPRESKANSKAISISFGKVLRDKISERILILRNPSQPIPLEIETIDRLEVRFEFQDQEETTITFEVASVRDFTLRVKAKAADLKTINKIEWDKCTRAVVNANNPTELMGKLIDAFKKLGVEDDFNFKDNLQNNVSFVFGPPGTGKTTYVSSQICDLMQKEDHCKILVLTPTNKACDVITERIAQTTDNPRWLGRFVATGSDIVEQNGLLINRDSELYEEDRCCIVSTIARLPYDGFVVHGGAPRLRELDWDYVIIDEASMIPLAQIVYAIYQFSPYSRIIVAGDPLQIPPIVAEEEWQDENIYTMVNLQRFDNPQTEPIHFEVTNLSTQYRSVPAIGEVFSRYSYAGLLKHYRSQSEQAPIKIEGLPMKTINFIQFKVEKYDNIFGPKKLAGSNVQIYSVLLVTELCQYIAKNYKGDKDLNIGIICPYVAESQMIERLIEQQENMPENINFNVGTIHGFQGDECDIVFVVFNPPKAMGTQPERIMLNRKHIINVAISRAKDFLFVLFPHPSTDGFKNLYEIRNLGRLTTDVVGEHVKTFTCDDIEQIMFGKKFYLENNTFVTSHQMANVYTEPGMKYEVRIDDNSVDIQISDL